MTRNGINSDSTVWRFIFISFSLLVVLYLFIYLNTCFKFMPVKKGSYLQQFEQVLTGADAASLSPVPPAFSLCGVYRPFPQLLPRT